MKHSLCLIVCVVLQYGCVLENDRTADKNTMAVNFSVECKQACVVTFDGERLQKDVTEREKAEVIGD